ncbi:hypothetical protein [Compostimonas suwonensis]|uniref:hypothetical protein n=1 Tax=Compostimonas suwonensis TaxID=1048394 RepID=UPI0012FE0DB5|nr:hypothetical protein [Compostimonas suwonensis]
MHDSTIGPITIDWDNGAVEIPLKIANDVTGTIIAQGLRLLVMPRMHPWGPARTVYELSINGEDWPDATSVQILAQTGDNISIEADTFEYIVNSDERPIAESEAV